MNVKKHYDDLLGEIYSWMAGDFETKKNEQQRFFEENNIRPYLTKTAIDLGAGHGLQSIPLADLGFKVTAVDFNKHLLSELKSNSKEYDINVIEDDLRSVRSYAEIKPELIVCAGDTITHLESKEEIKKLIKDCCDILAVNGKLILTFRDYSFELSDDKRFIPVESDDSKILTCCLDFEQEKVRVTDIFYYKDGNDWKLKVSSYYKIRILPDEIREIISSNGLKILFDQPVKGLITIIAVKL